MKFQDCKGFDEIIHIEALLVQFPKLQYTIFKIMLLTVRVVFLIISCNNRITTNHLMYWGWEHYE